MASPLAHVELRNTRQARTTQATRTPSSNDSILRENRKRHEKPGEREFTGRRESPRDVAARAAGEFLGAEKGLLCASCMGCLRVSGRGRNSPRTAAAYFDCQVTETPGVACTLWRTAVPTIPQRASYHTAARAVLSFTLQMPMLISSINTRPCALRGPARTRLVPLRTALLLEPHI